MELHGCEPKNSGDLSLLFSTFHTQITGGFFWARDLRPFGTNRDTKITMRK